LLCPVCKYECVEGTKVCSTCGSQLVNELPTEDDKNLEPEYVEYVTIMETRDPALIAFIKSIFQDANIKYFINGETLLSLGRAAVDVRVEVEKHDAETAIALLEMLK
jgi:hypothetical protein